MSKDKKARKQELIIQKKKEEKRKRQLKRIGVFTGILAIFVSILFVIMEKQKPLPGEQVKIMEKQSHLEDITTPHTPYNSDPPTSGEHAEFLANWGVHEEEVPKEVLVHNLEDGGIVIYYNKNVAPSTLEELEKIVESYSDKVILTPYMNMEDAITLTAWGRIDRLDQFDEQRIKSFIQAFRGIDHH